MMKTKILMIALAEAALLCVSCVTFGNGETAAREQAYGRFNSVTLAVDGEVRLHSSEDYRVTLTCDSNLAKYVMITNAGGDLKIKTKRGRRYSFTRFTVDVYCPKIEAVTASSSGDIVFADQIKTARFTAKASSSGSINGNIDCGAFTARASSSGDITMKGVCKSADVHLSSDGNFDGTELVVNESFDAILSSSGSIEMVKLDCGRMNLHLSSSGSVTMEGSCEDALMALSSGGGIYGKGCEIDNCDITISSSGKANLWVTDTLKARLTGSGEVRYRGSPKFDFSGSSSAES